MRPGLRRCFIISVLAWSVVTIGHNAVASVARTAGDTTNGEPPVGLQAQVEALRADLEEITSCGEQGRLFASGLGSCRGAIAPDHEWSGSRLRFQQAPVGVWGEYVDLRGPVGPPGPSCDFATECKKGPPTKPRPEPTCSVAPRVTTEPCLAPRSGEIRKVQEFDCGAGRWLPWRQTASCEDPECKPEIERRVESCEESEKSFQEEREYICGQGGGEWTEWVPLVSVKEYCEPESECEEKTESRAISCPEGYEGKVTEERALSCPDGIWSPWSEAASTCRPACESKSETRTISCGSGFVGEVVERRDFQCPSRVWGGWLTVTDTCRPACESKEETRSFACPGGRAGQVTEQRRYSCPEGQWSTWTEVSNDCAAICPGGQVLVVPANPGGRDQHPTPAVYKSVPETNRLGEQVHWHCGHFGGFGGNSYVATCTRSGWRVSVDDQCGGMGF